MPNVECRIHAATYAREDARGAFIEVVNHGPWETVITGRMRDGAVLGNHFHKKTRVFFFMIDGAAQVEIADVHSGSRRSCTLAERQGVFLEVNEAHAIRFRSDSSFVLLKSRQYSEQDSDTYEFVVAESAGFERSIPDGGKR